MAEHDDRHPAFARGPEPLLHFIRQPLQLLRPGTPQPNRLKSARIASADRNELADEIRSQPTQALKLGRGKVEGGVIQANSCSPPIPGASFKLRTACR